MGRKLIARADRVGKKTRTRYSHSENRYKHERIPDREMDSLHNAVVQGTRKAASHSRSVSNIHVYVKDGKLIQQQDEAVTVLKRLKTEKMKVGVRFNLSNVKNANVRKKQKIESLRWS